MQPLYISYARHAPKLMGIAIVVLVIAIALIVAGIVVIPSRPGGGTTTIIIGVILVIGCVRGMREGPGVKNGFLCIGPEGISTRNVKGQFAIGWNEIAWVAVDVAIIGVPSYRVAHDRIGTTLRLASTYGFNGRHDMDVLRNGWLPEPYTHEISVMTDNSYQVPSMETQQIADALAMFGGQRFAGLGVRLGGARF